MLREGRAPHARALPAARKASRRCRELSATEPRRLIDAPRRLAVPPGGEALRYARMERGETEAIVRDHETFVAPSGR